MKRLILPAAGLIFSSGTAFAHHGWSEYQADKPLDLSGTIEQAGYEQPHGFIRLKTADNKTWLVVLAPPSRPTATRPTGSRAVGNLAGSSSTQC